MGAKVTRIFAKQEGEPVYARENMERLKRPGYIAQHTQAYLQTEAYANEITLGNGNWK